MMIVFKNCFFGRYYRKCLIFFLNKYKKENRVIELDLAAGKKIKEVA